MPKKRNLVELLCSQEFIAACNIVVVEESYRLHNVIRCVLIPVVVCDFLHCLQKVRFAKQILIRTEVDDTLKLGVGYGVTCDIVNTLVAHCQ